jgi:protein TonB
MTSPDNRLLLTLGLSLALHLLPFMSALLPSPPTAQPTAQLPIQATLQARPAQPEIRLEPPKPPPQSSTEHNKPQATTSGSKPAKPKDWTHQVREHLRKLDQDGQFYPAEAIARGLEGEVLIFMILGTEGQVVAARIEQRSPHPILDDAALRAIRSLRSLPADAPREVLIPVRFRLH